MDNLEFEFIECLNEMASVRPIGQTSILLAINPDDNRDGDPYFKMYDSNSWGTATKVWRIRFDRAELIKKHKGRIPAAVSINSKEKENLVEYLGKPSRDFKNAKIWDELKYRWNVEKGLMDQFGFENYLDGTADKFYSNRDTKRNYIPMSLLQPDYTLL